MGTASGVTLGRGSLAGVLGLPRPDLKGPFAALVAAAMTLSLVVVIEPLVTDRAEAEPATAAVTAEAGTPSQLVAADEVPARLTGNEWASIQREIASAGTVEATPAVIAQGQTTAVPFPMISSATTVASFSPTGAVIAASSSASSIGLHTRQVGEVSLSATSSTSISGRAYYLHTPTITEWYRNTPEGLQQLFTLAEPVTSSPTTVIEVAVASGTPTLIDSQMVSIATIDGARFAYHDLVAWDATGAALDGHIDVVDGVITLNIDTDGATYPVTVDPIITTVDKVLAPSGLADERFGTAVSIDGNRMAVGSPDFDGGAGAEGAVFMFERAEPGAAWTFDARIDHWTPVFSDGEFGAAVAVRGDRVAIGDPVWTDGEEGYVAVYERQAGGWEQLGNEFTGDGGSVYGFGASMAWQTDDILVVGAPFAKPVGAGTAVGGVYQSTWSGSAWTTTHVSTPGLGTDDELGFSVDVGRDQMGDYIIVAGAPGDDGATDTDPGAGALYIYRDAGPGASASYAQTVQAPWNTGDRVGTAVATDRGVIAVAGLAEQLSDAEIQVHVLEDLGSGYLIVTSITDTLLEAITGEPNDYIELFGHNLFLGRPGSSTDQVDILRPVDATGIATTPADEIRPLGGVLGDQIGSTISVDDRSIAIGAPGDDDNGTDAGAAYTLEDLPLTHTFIGEGPWNFAANWDTGLVPDDNDTAIIPDSKGFIAVLGDHSVGRLVVGDGSTVRVLEGASLTITGGSNGGEDSDIDGELGSEAGGTINLDASQGDFIIGGLVGSSGVWRNEGTLNKTGAFDVTVGIFGGSLNWISGGSSRIDVAEGSLDVGVGTYPELGDLSIQPGASLGFSDNLWLDPASVVDISISGPSSDSANYGVLDALGSPVFGPATLRATLLDGYVPTASDAYPVVTCGFCEAFGTYDTGDLVATVGSNDITLTLPGALVVNSTGDAADANTSDGRCETAVPGVCTLRAAIQQANATAGADTIAFGIPGAGAHTIAPATALPAITDTVTIDGYTQLGASANTLAIGSDAVLLIELDGSSASGAVGLDFTAPGSTASVVRGLAINRFTGGGVFAGPSTQIRGNYIGLDATGTIGRPNGVGVFIGDAATSPVIVGGSVPADRNVISGNNSKGVEVPRVSDLRLRCEDPWELHRHHAERHGVRAERRRGYLARMARRPVLGAPGDRHADRRRHPRRSQRHRRQQGRGHCLVAAVAGHLDTWELHRRRRRRDDAARQRTHAVCVLLRRLRHPQLHVQQHDRWQPPR